MIDERCDELIAAAAASDVVAFETALPRLWDAVQGAGPDQLSRVLERICGLFEVVPLGPASHLAVLAGALVEDGADPDVLVDPVVDGLAASLERAAEFAEAWQSAFGDRLELPEPVEDQRTFDGALARLSGRRSGLLRRRRSSELSEVDASRLAEGWFSAGRWTLPATTLLQIARVRAELPARRVLTEAAERVVPLREDLECLVDLLAVLDDEQLLVLHRPSGRGFEVTISGVGDNFQLQTLLAATLIGDPADGLLDGAPPDPTWVAAATDGPLEPPGGPIMGQFTMVDATGRWIWHEGVPADIPVLDGRRVVVLDPPPYQRAWNLGRQYPRMRPEVRLDRVLPADEAAGWLTRVAPPTPPES